MLIVVLVCALFVSTFTHAADEVPAIKLCQDYQNLMVPNAAGDETNFEITNSYEPFNAILKTGYPRGHSFFEVKSQHKIPYVSTNYFSVRKLGNTHARLHKLHFYQYFINQNQQGKAMFIRIHFEVNGNHEIVVQVPVLEVKEDDDVKKNEELDLYLQHVEPKTEEMTKHVLYWINDALMTPVKCYKKHRSRRFKIDTYYGRCQYVPMETVRKFAERFEWNEN